MGSITMIASGKDGVGKSAVAALTGEALALRKKKVLLIEFENGLRCQDVYLNSGNGSVYDVSDALCGRCQLSAAISPSPLCANLSVLFASNRREPLNLPQFGRLVLALAEKYDHLLIDTDCSDETLDAAAAVAMNSIVVATADPMGVRDAKYVCDRLYERKTPNIRLLLNRVNPLFIGKKLVPNLDYCIDAVGAQLIGLVPELADVALCTSSGKLLPESGLARRIFSNIASRLEGEDVPLAVM